MAYRDTGEEEFWRRTLEPGRHSGLSAASFCRREQLAAWSLHWWRRELARRRQGHLVLCTSKGNRNLADDRNVHTIAVSGW